MKASMTFKKRRAFLRHVYAITVVVCSLIQLAYFGSALVNSEASLPIYKLLTFSPLIIFLAIGLSRFRKWTANVLSFYFVASCYLTLVFYTAITGGLVAPGIVWFLICPIVSFLILSREAAKRWLCIVLFTLIIFFFFEDTLVIGDFGGKSFWYLFSYVLFFTTLFRIVWIFIKIIDDHTSALKILNQHLLDRQDRLLVTQSKVKLQNENLRKAEQNTIARTERLEMYLNKTLEISRMEELHNGNLKYAIQSLEHTLSDVMQLNYVSIWTYDDSCSALISVSQSMKMDKTNTVTGVLSVNDYKQTFELLEAGAIIYSSDDRTTGELGKFRHQLGIEHDTNSILGCPFFIDGKFSGMIVCAAMTKRKWAAEDIIFVRAISDALCLSFKSDHRRENQMLLQEKQIEITKLNESLEEKVNERAAELKLRNEQLLNFAFINAHEIRGPLCRLLGLRNLLDRTDNPDEIISLRDYLSFSIEELDDITRKASKLLNETIS